MAKHKVKLVGGPRDGAEVMVSAGATEYNVAGNEQDGAYVVKKGVWTWEPNKSGRRK
jgi:hypothetical protein